MRPERRFLFSVLCLLAALFLLPGVQVFAKDALRMEADRNSVDAGDAVVVTVRLTGKEIWAYEIELSSNEVFAGGQTFVNDADGGSEVVLSCEFYALIPGQGEIYAEGSYSDGSKIVSLKEAKTVVSVRGEEDAPRGTEGTGGQAGPGAVINGETVPEAPAEATPEEAVPSEPDDGSRAEEGPEEESFKAASSAQKEPLSVPAEKEAAKEAKNAPRWILPVCIAAAVPLATGIILAVRKRRKK